MKNAYYRGRASGKSKLPIEFTDSQIVSAAQTYRTQLFADNKDIHKDKHHRILFQIPPSGVGVVWFYDLIQCFRYSGIECQTVKWDDSDFKQIWEDFLPTIFITLDSPEVLKSLDLEYIKAYKEEHSCLRLFTPITKESFPTNLMSKMDEWRLDLASRGLSADAYFSMMVEDHFRLFFREWYDLGFQYLSLPNACNPFRHYPEEAEKDADYFVVTSYSLQRAEITKRYLENIFRSYYGLWGGERWKFGVGRISRSELRGYYARARISPHPLMPFLIEYPAETSERSFSSIACGAFQITHRTPVTGRFFAEDELVCVDDEKEFVDAFDHYISRPDERNQIVLNGIDRVFKEHTYFHRIDQLVRFIDELITIQN